MYRKIISKDLPMVAVGEKRPKGNDLCPEDIRIGFCTLAFNLHGET
jgi:hypothetical protein